MSWSGWEDSNFRPPDPETGALPGCATAGLWAGILQQIDTRYQILSGAQRESVISQLAQDGHTEKQRRQHHQRRADYISAYIEDAFQKQANTCTVINRE